MRVDAQDGDPGGNRAIGSETRGREPRPPLNPKDKVSRWLAAGSLMLPNIGAPSLARYWTETDSYGQDHNIEYNRELSRAAIEGKALRNPA